MLPEGAERVSRAAARLCERPRSLPTRATAPAGPQNQGAPTAGRSCAPPGAGRCFWRDRWRRSRGSLADRLAIGGPAGPGRQTQFLREREPNIGLLLEAHFLKHRPDESGAGILPAWARKAGRMPAPLSNRQGCVCFQNFLQSNSPSRLLPVPEVSCLASRKLSPTESSEEPGGITEGPLSI